MSSAVTIIKYLEGDTPMQANFPYDLRPNNEAGLVSFYITTNSGSDLLFAVPLANLISITVERTP